MKNLNYGVIGNCRSAALVSDKGSIDWFCMPDFDSPSVFARILDDEKGGYFSIETGINYKISQKYLIRTNILCTEFRSDEGVFELIDFMTRYKISDDTYFAPSEVYRYIKYIWGKPVFRVRYHPAFNYALEKVSSVSEEKYIRSFSLKVPTDCIYLYTSLDHNAVINSDEITLTEHQFMLLSYNQKLIEIDIDRVYMEFQRTKVYWLNWTNHSKKYWSYSDAIIRSLLVLKIMSFQPTGAVLAAVTTSIPETIGGVRNWDYRFCWLRDASMLIDTLVKMGHFNSAQRFLAYLKGILKTKNDTFQVMYGIRGEKELTEKILDHLSGYENSRPVRVGNAAFTQVQNDVFGYLLDVIYQYFALFPGTLDEIEDMWEIVRNIAFTVSTHWERPDKGIWEIRHDVHHFVFSKVMSWVALDRAAKIAMLLDKHSYLSQWRSTANDIKADILKNGWNDKIQSFTQTYDNSEVDASLLLMNQYGFIQASDEKYLKTVIAIKSRLFRNGLLYRYINADDFGKPESAFTICTFWLIQALYNTGFENDARQIFEDLLNKANHLGLFSEDIDFNTGRLLGNFPQAYSHLALINTATLFSDERHAVKHKRP